MKKILLFGFALCAVCVVAPNHGARAAVFQESGRAAVYYRDGARFALEGRLEEAIAAFEQSIALDPKNGNTYYSLGNVYSELGRWGEAVAAYRKAISLNKNDVEAYNGLGVALDHRGVYAQAAGAFERAIDIYPKWAEPHYRVSEVYKKLGRGEEAEAAYSRAVRLRPDYAARPPQTFVTKGLTAGVAAPPVRNSSAPSGPVAADEGARTARGSAPARAATPAPIGTPDRSARPDAGDARSYLELGDRHVREGRREEAVAAFRQAVMLDRSNAGAYLALGDAYAGLGRWRESVDAYEQAVRLSPQDSEAYERLGRSYAKLREATPTRPGDGGAAVGVRTAAPSGASADTPAEKVAPRVADGAPMGAAEAPPSDGVDPTTVYRVGAGDVLDVRVLNGRPQPQQRATRYTVTPAGLLDYPLLAAPLQVAGLTTEEIGARLATELKRRAGAAPEIVVGVREYASHTIIVSGMVRDPGTKILRREGVPLYVIIAHAQPLADAGRALIVSRATGRSTTVDLSDARASNLLVRPGDVITVQPRPKQFFYIAGAVREPGQKAFDGRLTLTQAILAAGGATSTSSSSTYASVARQGSDGRLTSNRYNLREIGAGKAPDPVVQAGDRIEVLR